MNNNYCANALVERSWNVPLTREQSIPWKQIIWMCDIHPGYNEQWVWYVQRNLDLFYWMLSRRAVNFLLNTPLNVSVQNVGVILMPARPTEMAYRAGRWKSNVTTRYQKTWLCWSTVSTRQCATRWSTREFGWSQSNHFKKYARLVLTSNRNIHNVLSYVKLRMRLADRRMR